MACPSFESNFIVCAFMKYLNFSVDFFKFFFSVDFYIFSNILDRVRIRIGYSCADGLRRCLQQPAETRSVVWASHAGDALHRLSWPLLLTRGCQQAAEAEVSQVAARLLCLTFGFSACLHFS